MQDTLHKLSQGGQLRAKGTFLSNCQTYAHPAETSGYIRGGQPALVLCRHKTLVKSCLPVPLARQDLQGEQGSI
jgi:hypothetical protein